MRACKENEKRAWDISFDTDCKPISEFVPPSTKAQDLATKWTDIVAESGDDGRAGRFRAVVVSKANHKIEDETAQHSLVTEVQQTLLRVLGEAENDEKFGPTGPPGQSSGAAGTDQHRGGEQYPASFDEVVELISTGRAESIPGIKHIPLQVRLVQPEVFCHSCIICVY